jgi:hypothetical protein
MCGSISTRSRKTLQITRTGSHVFLFLGFLAGIFAVPLAIALEAVALLARRAFKTLLNLIGYTALPAHPPSYRQLLPPGCCDNATRKVAVSALEEGENAFSQRSVFSQSGRGLRGSRSLDWPRHPGSRCWQHELRRCWQHELRSLAYECTEL